MLVLLLGNVYVNSRHQTLRSEVSLVSDKVLGLQASLFTLSDRLDEGKGTLESVTKDGGNKLFDDYQDSEEKRRQLFEEFYRISKAMLEAKKKSDEDKMDALKAELSKVVTLGNYSHYEFLRDDSWSMIYYDNLPRIDSSIAPVDSIGVVDKDGRTLAMFQMMFDEEKNHFNLLSADLTLELLEPTAIYNFGEGDVATVVEGGKHDKAQ